MAATSPYSPNDYQAVSNYRPYELPINDIFRAISAQNEFWNIGAKRVKAVYENALDLDLTLDANKEVKKQFMDAADKQLTRLSSMDLSDPSVQRQGFNIYKPLFQDESIMYDNQLTKTMKGIYSDAESYKRKKLSSTGAEGEGYTDRNLAYSLDGFENFNSSTPRNPALLKEMHQKLGNRKFSPYYNPTQEYSSILKNCKGSGGEKQDVASNYMYFDSFSKTGANSSETSNCFMMGLSEKAKQQIGIDGWAYYKGNPQLLADDHRQFALGKQKQQLDAIKGKIAGIKSGGITDSEKPVLKELEDMLPALQKEYDNRETEYNQMVGGNALNYVTQNFQTLSKGIYLSKNYAALGEAFKSDETSRKLTANAAGIAQFNAIEKMYQQEREHNYQMDEIRERYKYQLQLKLQGNIISPDLINPLNPPVTEATDTNQSYGEQAFNNEKDLAFKAYSDSYQALVGYMTQKDPTLKKGDMLDAYILNYANEHSKKPAEQQDKQFNELMGAYNNTKNNYASLDMRQKAVNISVENELGLKGKTYKIGDVDLTWDELVQVKQGKTIKGVTYNPEQVKSYTSSPGAASSYSPAFFSIPKKNGKGNNIYWGDPHKEELEKAQTRRDELFRKQYYEAQGYISPRINLEEKDLAVVDNQIRNILGVQEGNNKKNGYKLIGHDKTGKDLLVVPLDDKGNEVAPNLQRARSLNVNVTEEKMGTSVNAIRIPNVLPALSNLPSSQQTSAIRDLRDFQVLMESQLKSKGSYFSSDNLKNTDGTVYPYTTFSFQTPRGTNVRVKAVKSNGQIKLVPSIQLKSGGWDENFQSFATPEELVLYFRTQ